MGVKSKVNHNQLFFATTAKKSQGLDGRDIFMNLAISSY